jgi:GTP-binding protein
MFGKQNFIQSIFKISDIPKNRLPEVILCGRSNVGKSSFINSFFNRKDLAKVSSTPGKTRSINFYEIDHTFYVIDLPGFGYAKTGKTQRIMWSRLIEEFISSSNYIRLAIHFIDSRHKPTELDYRLNKLLHELNIPYIILLSKVDKLKQAELSLTKKNLVEFLPEVDLNSSVVNYSSVKPVGKKNIVKLFQELFY